MDDAPYSSSTDETSKGSKSIVKSALLEPKAAAYKLNGGMSIMPVRHGISVKTAE